MMISYMNTNAALGFNGINLALTEPDALNRSMMIDLETIDKSKRRQESEIIAEFQSLRY